MSKLLFTNGNNPSNPFKLGDQGVKFPSDLLQSAGTANSGATNNFAYLGYHDSIYYVYPFTDYYLTLQNATYKFANNVSITEESGGGQCFPVIQLVIMLYVC